MFLTDFVQERGIEYNTAYQWLRRNRFLEKHCTRVDGKLFLDATALQSVKRKYPLAIEQEKKLSQELQAAQNKIIKLQELLIGMQPKLLLADEQAKSFNKLEENYQEAISKLGAERNKNRCLESDLSISRSRSESLEEKCNELQAQVSELTQTIEKEKAKSWLDKLLKR